MDRALIIKKEWADKLFSGEKIWEMRCTKTKIRGVVGIIEAGSGKIVGQMEIIDSPGPIEPTNEHFLKHRVKDVELLKKWKYPWVVRREYRWSHHKIIKVPRGAMIWVKLER